MSMLKQNNVKIVLSSKSWVIERSSEFDYRSFVNRTFDCVRLAKFYFEFDYVRLSSAIERRLGSIAELFDGIGRDLM